MAASSKSKASKANAEEQPSSSTDLWSMVWMGVALYVTFLVLSSAYQIRLGAINEFGLVIHEFDPWFNYRATEYLYWNGAKRFFQWFDHMSWYPLGRPVGTTIYPGMQFTAVAIKEYLLPNVKLNDICCYIPVWFGVMATATTGAIAYECSIPRNTHTSLLGFLLDGINGRKTLPDPATLTNNNNAATLPFGFFSPALPIAIFCMGMMAIVPAHLMRSMGGGYDNESIAVFAMVFTFYCWVRSLRTHGQPLLWGIATGCAYFYMVAAWGGYVFVLNLIGVHAAVLVGVGRFSNNVYTAYTAFYLLGTCLATRVPVVGLAPLKSLEQLGPGAVFLGYQILQACDVLAARRGLSRGATWKLRVQFGALAVGAVALAAVALAPTGYFGPLSSRVRGLFVPHTKTGNPLVDSVAEHQAANSQAYFQYLHHVCTFAPMGYLLVMVGGLSDASSFLLVWGTAAYFFSHKMVRLILLTAPIGSILGGVCVGRMFAWCTRVWWEEPSASTTKEKSTGSNKDSKKGKRGNGKSKTSGRQSSQSTSSSFEGFQALEEAWSNLLNTTEGMFVKRGVALLALCLFYLMGNSFVMYSWRLSQDLSNPSIILKGRLRSGEVITVDDYREAYWWLRDNTPEDARVMAWWDYGYQIAGIANRTTIADGNTWNHEHIALLGKALTTNLEEGYEIARHWADYVLLWTGGGGDDLAKSPHLARIANSVYRDHCPDDPTCRAFGFIDRQGTPSPMMKRSFMYNLHSHEVKEGAVAPSDKFKEVYRSKYGKVRIFKILGVSEESKQWVADPANRNCDANGSWFCPGQYPPGLSKILERKTDFAQLEDFNRKGGSDNEYTKRYFEDLKNPESARRKALQKELEERKQGIKADVDAIYNRWEDTDDTTRMWEIIDKGDVAALKAWLAESPEKAYVRSSDGRGPMWWAFEKRNEEMTKILMLAGLPYTDHDKHGKTPLDLQKR